MPELLVARNPYTRTRLPFLLRVPLEPVPLIVCAREEWPQQAAVFCVRRDKWIDHAEILRSVPLILCHAHDNVVEVIAADNRHHRTRFVINATGAREIIFWHSQRSNERARASYRIAAPRMTEGEDMEILVDAREHHPYRFQSAAVRVRRQRLSCGDYAVTNSANEIFAAVERKTVADLARSLVDGTLSYQLAELETLPRAAVVVEGTYGDVSGVPRVRDGFLAVLVARVQFQYPGVPLVFCDTRSLAQRWTYLYLRTAEAALQDAQRRRPVRPPLAGDGEDGGEHSVNGVLHSSMEVR